MLAERRRRAFSIRRAPLGAVRAEIGLQQRELHQVELGAAAADALEFAGDRLKRIDGGAVIGRRSNAAKPRTAAGTSGPDG